jgi:hypothetical protein
MDFDYPCLGHYYFYHQFDFGQIDEDDLSWYDTCDIAYWLCD